MADAMAKIVPAPEVGLPEGTGRVRISTSRDRRGKILAVEHPIFGWLKYRDWALIQLVPEKNIVPAAIMGVASYAFFTGIKQAGNILFPTELKPAEWTQNIPLIRELAAFLAEHPIGGIPPIPQFTKGDWPAMAALMVAAVTLAGLDPGDLFRGIAEMIDAIIPG